MRNSLFKKITSIIIAFTILMNLIPNFGLLGKVSYAADVTSGIVIKPGTSEFKEIDGKKIYKLNIYLRNVTTGIWYIDLNYNSNKMVPARVEDEDTVDALARKATKADQAVAWADETNLFVLETSMDRELVNNTDGTGHIYFGGISATDEELVVSDDLLICTVNFMIQDTSLNIGDIAIDDFSIGLNSSMINIDYEDCFASDYPEYFGFDGFNTVTTPVVTSIAITTDPKKEYIVGDSLDLSSMKVTATYDNDSSKTKDLTNSEYTTNAGELDLTTPGTKTLTVTYEGTDIAEGAAKPTASVDITVREAKVTSLRIDGISTSYKQGTEINLSTISVMAIDEKGEEKLLTDKYTLTATGNSIADGKIKLDNAVETTITATYKGTDIAEGVTTPLTATHTIEVTAKVLTGIEVTAPTQETYTVGEALNLAGMEVKAIYDNDEANPVTITEGYTTSIAGGAELTATGVNTITVGYNGKEATFDVVVFPTKLVGTAGDNLSTVVVEGFEWVNNNTIAVGENEYELKYTNTEASMQKTCNVKVLGIPSNLTATYGQTLADVTLPAGKGFSWADTTASVGDVGEQSHDITYDGYTGLQAKVTVGKATLTKEDLTYTMPNERVYDGTATTVDVKAPTGAGDVKVKYKAGEDVSTATTEAPVDAGTYKVLVSVEVGTNYTALAETELGSFTIAKATLASDDFDLINMPEGNTKQYDGTTVEVTSKIKEEVSGADDIREQVQVKYYKDGDTVGTDTAPSDKGTYEVKVSVIEGKNYEAVNELLIGTFSITKTQLTEEEIEFTAPDPNVYDGEAKTATVAIKDTVVGAGAGAITTIEYYKDGEKVENPIDAGTYTVKVNITEGTNYAGKTDWEIGTFTIEKANLTLNDIEITTPEAKDYDEEASIATTRVKATLPGADDVTVNVTYVDGEGNNVENPTNAGTYTIKVSSEGGKNYNALGLTDTTKTIVINKKALTIGDVIPSVTLPSSRVYDGTATEITVTVPTGAGTATVKYYKEDGTEATELKNANTYTVKVSVEEGTNYTALPETVLGTYEITKATLTLDDFVVENVPENNQKQYDAQPLEIDALLKEGIIGAGENIQIKYYKNAGEYLITPPSATGTYIVKININEGTNYFAANGTAEYPEIEIGTVTITPRGFDASKINYTPTAEYDGTVKTDDITIDGDTITSKTVKYYQEIDGVEQVVEPKNVGRYTIKADITTESCGDIGTITIGDFEITKRKIELTIGNATNVYGNNFEAAIFEGEKVTVTRGQVVEGDNLNVTLNSTKKNVGEYESSISGEVAEDNTVAKNYDIDFVEGKYTITPKPVTIIIGNTESVYGEPIKTLTNDLLTLKTGENLAYDEQISDLGITLTKADGTNVGTYEITGTSSNANYTVTFENEDNSANTGTYEITRATLKRENFDVENMPTGNVTFGEEINVTATPNVNGAGNTTIVKYYKVDGGTETFLGEGVKPTDAGTYTVKVNVNEGDNYYAADGTEGKPEITLGNFIIVQNSLDLATDITISPTTFTYDGNSHTPAVTGPIDFDGTIIPTYWQGETEVTNPTNAGEYTVKITTTGAINYANITDPTEVGTFTIEKAEPTYTLPTGLIATYGDALSSVELPEGFTWEETGTVGNAGTRTHTIKYTPTDSNYKEVTGIEVQIEVAKADPEYNLGNLTATYGDTLADVELPEGFTWEVAESTSVGNAGEHTFKVTFTPTDTDNYNILTNIDATVTVAKAIPAFTKPTGLEGYEGQPLSSIDITEHTGFNWTNADTTLPLIKDNGKTFNTTMIFTPVDTDNYQIVEDISVEVKVKENEIQAIRVTSTKLDGSNPEYFEGQTFNRDDILVEAEWAIGGWQTVTDYTITDETRKLTTSDTKMVINYEGMTAEQPITVNVDSVTDITIVAPDKKEYNYGDAIDLTGATITKIWASGKTETIPMTKEMLSNDDITSFDGMDSLGEKGITVTYGSVVKTNAFQVKIEDYVDRIEIEDKTKLKTEYEYGDTINVTDKNTGAKLNVLVKYAGGTPDERVELTTSMVSGYSMTTLGNQTVTVTHLGKTDSYTINVKDKVTGIEITKEPAKKVYKLGESANFGDIVVKNVMASSAQGTILSVGEYTISGFDSTMAGEKTITVTKVGTTHTDTFRIKVIDATTAMNITDMPKTTYNYGEGLSIAGGTITVKTQGNVAGTEIPMTDSSVKVTGYNPNRLGDQTLTVTYTYTEETDAGIETKTLTDTYTVTVNDYETGAIQITPPTKTTYDYGEGLDLTGGKVSKVWASGKTTDTTPIDGGMVSGYNPTKTGIQTLTVTHWGKTATFNVTVVDRTLGISMNKLPNKTQYTQGEAIDVTGAVLNVTKQSGTKEIPITKEMISGYNPSKIGTQIITVTYDGKQTQFVVTVKEAPKKPTTPTKPTKPTKPTRPTRPTNPSKPSTSDTVKYTVKFVDYNGTVLKEEEVESGKSATAPEVETRVGYKFLGWDRAFDTIEKDMIITAKYERIIRAEVNAPDNMQIEEGEEIDLSEVTLIIRDEEGNEIDEIPVTEDMISGFDSEEIGRQVITVTYVDEDGYEYTATFKVRVIAGKPVETLGVKDEVKDNDNDLNKMILPVAVGAGTAGLLLILLALVTRKNVEIYAITDDKRELVGKEKISKKNTRIALEEYEKRLESANMIEIVLNKNITKKLDEETVSVVFKGMRATYRVSCKDDKEFSIIIKNV